MLRYTYNARLVPDFFSSTYGELVCNNFTAALLLACVEI